MKNTTPLFSNVCALFAQNTRGLLTIPFWNGLPIPFRLPHPERLRESATGVHGGWRPRRSPREAGCDTWTPFSFRQVRRDRSAACVRSAGAPSRSHRFPWPLLPSPPRYAGPRHRAPASLAQHETFPACVPRCAGAQIASRSARRQSGHFPSTAPSPLVPAACCRSAAPVSASSPARNARAASARAQQRRTTPLRWSTCAALETWLKHRSREVWKQDIVQKISTSGEKRPGGPGDGPTNTNDNRVARLHADRDVAGREQKHQIDGSDTRGYERGECEDYSTKNVRSRDATERLTGVVVVVEIQGTRREQGRYARRRENPYTPEKPRFGATIWQVDPLFAGEAIEGGHLALHLLAGGVGRGANALDAQLEFIGVGGARQSFVERDELFGVEIEERLIKGLHAVLAGTGGDGVMNQTRLVRIDDAVADVRGGDHNFTSGHAALVIGAAHEAL